jgi:UDP-N-acetylglucosamine--N-acetylmuramyl-(pentapeptide) pyrophosphoryl-undecaprenol N-acetylglucosamine transferase
MFPAQSLAEEMLSRGWRVTLSTDERGARYAKGFPDDVIRKVVTSATFARGGLAGKLKVPLRIAGGIASAKWQFLRDRPDVVAGFGGYPSIPALAAATILRIPRLLHEQNGVLGRVNQLFARRVDVMACGTWPTELPAGVEAVHVGNPVRSGIAAVGRTPLPEFQGGTRVLVLGGSQGARILSDIVPEAVAALPEHVRRDIEVSHQARPEDEERVREIYSGAGIEAVVRPFFDDVPDRLSNAHLLVSRAGASTIADVTVIGRPSILIPLAAAIRDEQTANARMLVEKGAALMITEDRLDPGRLCEAMAGILTSPSTAAEMSAAALSLAKPDAARDLADLVEGMAR